MRFVRAPRCRPGGAAAAAAARACGRLRAPRLRRAATRRSSPAPRARRAPPAPAARAPRRCGPPTPPPSRRPPTPPTVACTSPPPTCSRCSTAPSRRDTTHARCCAHLRRRARFAVHAPLPGGGQLRRRGRGQPHPAGRAGARRGAPLRLGPQRARATRAARSASRRGRRWRPARRSPACTGCRRRAASSRSSTRTASTPAPSTPTCSAVGNGGVPACCTSWPSSTPRGAARRRCARARRRRFASCVATAGRAAGRATPSRPTRSTRSCVTAARRAAWPSWRPGRASETPRRARSSSAWWPTDNPVGRGALPRLRQSMHNGGGPACLRLRIALTDAERAAVKAQRLLRRRPRTRRSRRGSSRHYRDRLCAADLSDPALRARVDDGARRADRASSRLGSVYDFQR